MMYKQEPGSLYKDLTSNHNNIFYIPVYAKLWLENKYPQQQITGITPRFLKPCSSEAPVTCWSLLVI